MPTFCRHNRFAANCPICRETEPAVKASPAAKASRSSRSPASSRRRGTGVVVRQAARSADDGYRSELAPGLRAAADAQRLAAELALAAGRLATLATAPPGLFGAVASAPDPEEALWLAFQIAYIGPLEDDDPFGAIESVRTDWASGELPALDDAQLGPRTAHDRARGASTLVAYRAWAARAGSQEAAFAGEPGWSAERRFARIFERLALPGLHRAARFDLLATLARVGRLDAAATTLALPGSADETSVAAKRVFGIGDPLLIDRRAAELAHACSMPFEALDLALFNWQRDEGRTTLGVSEAALDEEARDRIAAGLGVRL